MDVHKYTSPIRCFLVAFFLDNNAMTIHDARSPRRPEMAGGRGGRRVERSDRWQRNRMVGGRPQSLSDQRTITTNTAAGAGRLALEETRESR